MNAGIYAFSHAFVQVIEQWKKTDAKAAASLSYAFKKYSLNEFRLVHHKSDKLSVDTYVMGQVIAAISDSNQTLETHFDLMDSAIKDSAHYWQGHSADQTRHN